MSELHDAFTWEDIYLHEAGHATVAAALYFHISLRTEVEIVTSTSSETSTCLVRTPQGILSEQAKAATDTVINCAGLSALMILKPVHRWRIPGAYSDYRDAFTETGKTANLKLGTLSQFMQRLHTLYRSHRTAQEILRQERTFLVQIAHATVQNGGELSATELRALHNEYGTGTDYQHIFLPD